MIKRMDWLEQAQDELHMAAAARRSGNEGRARVCARRAAGHVIGEYLSRNNIPLETESALERLRYLQASPQISPHQRQIIQHFLVHTTPEHELPIDADLIAEADLLARQLLGQAISED
jgi:HEPN domain-containing protein